MSDETTSKTWARLVRAGQLLLERYVCKEDARGAQVLITAKGRELRKRMWTIYSPALHRHLADPFSRIELEQLAAPLGRLPG